jgi:Ca-activated chloride channel family protein
MPFNIAAVLFFAALAVLSFPATAASQAGRPAPSRPSGRVNQRPVSSPTPTPKPSPDAIDSEPLPTDAEEEASIISVETRLITMPVRVLDRRGRFIGGLTKENFRVLDNDVQQQIEYFQNEAQPFTVVLALDMSYSTVFKIDEIQAAAISFIEQLRPADRVIVMSFDQEVHFHCEATSDRKVIYQAIKQTKISTGTSLYEAVDQTMNTYLRQIEGRKAIVLFTDGVDTTSWEASYSQNINDASELDALIFPIRYDTFFDVQEMKNRPVMAPPDRSKQTTPPIGPTQTKGLPFPLPGPTVGKPSDKGTTEDDYRVAEQYLNQLADRTGGRIFVADNFGNLENAFKSIASELREFYSIGYYPAEDAKAGQTRRIKVRVDRENVAVRSRTSYIIPEPTAKK